MENQIRDFISCYNGAFELLDWGINDDYQRNGLWLRVKTRKHVNINSFSCGAIFFDIQGDIVTVNKGFLNEMAQGLSMIASFV